MGVHRSINSRRLSIPIRASTVAVTVKEAWEPEDDPRPTYCEVIRTADPVSGQLSGIEIHSCEYHEFEVVFWPEDERQ